MLYAADNIDIPMDGTVFAGSRENLQDAVHGTNSIRRYIVRVLISDSSPIFRGGAWERGYVHVHNYT